MNHHNALEELKDFIRVNLGRETLSGRDSFSSPGLCLEEEKSKEDPLISLAFEHKAVHSDPQLTTIRDGNSVKVRAESVVCIELFRLNRRAGSTVLYARPASLKSAGWRILSQTTQLPLLKCLNFLSGRVAVGKVALRKLSLYDDHYFLNYRMPV